MAVIDFLVPHFVWLDNPTAWVALLTLVVLEIVLGIDNLIFISILTSKLPPGGRAGAAAGHRRGADHAAGAAGDDLLHRATDDAGLHAFRPRLLGAT